jgi:5-methyltetrahydropteroyltriglutamate--homocysteine methyltransferase
MKHTILQSIPKALAFVVPEKLFSCTNCGMVPLTRKLARDKLEALAAVRLW